MPKHYGVKLPDFAENMRLPQSVTFTAYKPLGKDLTGRTDIFAPNDKPVSVLYAQIHNLYIAVPLFPRSL
jgi:hypothetical protein